MKKLTSVLISISLLLAGWPAAAQQPSVSKEEIQVGLDAVETLRDRNDDWLIWFATSSLASTVFSILEFKHKTAANTWRRAVRIVLNDAIFQQHSVAGGRVISWRPYHSAKGPIYLVEFTTEHGPVRQEVVKSIAALKMENALQGTLPKVKVFGRLSAGLWGLSLAVLAYGLYRVLSQDDVEVTEEEVRAHPVSLVLNYAMSGADLEDPLVKRNLIVLLQDENVRGSIVALAALTEAIGEEMENGEL